MNLVELLYLIPLSRGSKIQTLNMLARGPTTTRLIRLAPIGWTEAKTSPISFGEAVRLETYIIPGYGWLANRHDTPIIKWLLKKQDRRLLSRVECKYLKRKTRRK